MSQRHHAAVNGLTLEYLSDGPADAPVVVLVHGHGASAEDWTTIMDRLAPDHRVYALTLRGHRGSDWARDYTMDTYAADIAGFVTGLGLTEVTLVGHSLGGIACALAAQRRPSWLTRLVLEDAPIPSPGWFQRDLPERPTEFDHDWDRVAPQLNEALVDPDPRWWDELSNIAVPTLSVGGGPDSGFPQHNILGLGEAIPDFRAEVVEVGHLVHADAPDRFVTVLRTFLAG